MEKPNEAVLTIDWVYTTIMSSDFDLVTPIWLDITGVCGANGSEVSVPEGTTFAFNMEPSWNATVSGDLVLVGNHLHDGGVDLDVKKNNETICSGIANYGESPGYLEPMNMDQSHHHNNIDEMVMEHISSITKCLDIGTVKLGDTWSITAQYNLTAHPTMMEQDGKLAPVMGITLLYIADRKAG